MTRLDEFGNPRIGNFSRSELDAEEIEGKENNAGTANPVRPANSKIEAPHPALVVSRAKEGRPPVTLSRTVCNSPRTAVLQLRGTPSSIEASTSSGELTARRLKCRPLQAQINPHFSYSNTLNVLAKPDSHES